MVMRVVRWDLRRDGPFSEAALRHKVRALGCEPSTRVYPAHAIVSSPLDRRRRIQAVAAGLIKITLDSEAAILGAGDLALVPPDAAPCIEILGPVTAICLEAALPDGPT
jgi:hypothetical protein